MAVEWTLDQLSGYLKTWSAVARFRQEHGHSPVQGFIESVAALWGAPRLRRRIRWPLELRAGRVRNFANRQLQGISRKTFDYLPVKLSLDPAALLTASHENRISSRHSDQYRPDRPHWPRHCLAMDRRRAEKRCELGIRKARTPSPTANQLSNSGLGSRGRNHAHAEAGTCSFHEVFSTDWGAQYRRLLWGGFLSGQRQPEDPAGNIDVRPV